PGVAQALQALLHADIKLCCITNKDSLFAEPLLKQAGLHEFFAFTLCADRAMDRKPNPNMLLDACSRFGIVPAEMLYVGNSGVDVLAARAAGCPVVAVSYGYGKDHGSGDVEPDARVDELNGLVTICLGSSTDKPHLRMC